MTTTTHAFASFPEAVSFRQKRLAAARPDQFTRVGKPIHMTADAIWPRDVYTGSLYDALREGHRDHWAVTVEVRR